MIVSMHKGYDVKSQRREWTVGAGQYVVQGAERSAFCMERLLTHRAFSRTAANGSTRIGFQVN